VTVLALLSVLLSASPLVSLLVLLSVVLSSLPAELLLVLVLPSPQHKLTSMEGPPAPILDKNY
jgi:hypothetical protein